MRTIRNWVAALALLAIAPLQAQGPAPSQTTPAPTSAAEPDAQAAPAASPEAGAAQLTQNDLAAWLDGFMPYALARGEIAGAVVTVVRGDQVLLEKGYGYSNVAERTPVSPQTTLFRPGSVSKLFTWTAVMQLVEQGRIDLDADINQYLDFAIPDYRGEPITMRQVMTHSAGFEESMRNLIADDPEALMSLSDYVQESVPVRAFAPGTTPAYSNYATALAGHVVAQLSGMSFDDYVEAKIFRPLGMRYATFRQPLPERFERFMAQGYHLANEDPKPYEFVIPGPAGSLAASGSAMSKFMIAHLNGGGPILSPRTTAMMHDTRAQGVGPLNTMALGFYELMVNGRRVIAHGGDTQWFHSYLWLFPESDIGIFVSMNSEGTPGSAGALRTALLHQFADRYLPGEPQDGRVDAETAKQHAAMMAGNYSNSRRPVGSFMSILDLLGQTSVSVGPEGELIAPSFTDLADQPQKWVEVAPFVWRGQASGERLAAEVQDGKVVRISYDPYSPFMVFDRVSWARNAAWLLPAAIFAFAVVLLTALAWPGNAFARRRYGVAMPLAGRQKLAYRVSRGFAVLVTLVLLGWVWLVSTMLGDLTALGGSMDWLLYTLQILSPIAFFGLVAAAVWYAVLVWTGGRKWGAKIWSVVLVLASAILLWIALGFHLIGFGTLY